MTIVPVPKLFCDGSVARQKTVGLDIDKVMPFSHAFIFICQKLFFQTVTEYQTHSFNTYLNGLRPRNELSSQLKKASFFLKNKVHVVLGHGKGD